MAERHLVDMDAAVAAVLGNARQRERKRQMTPAQRKRATQDEQRSKVTYDLPAWLIEAIADLADAEQCSKSSVAAFLLVRALEAHQRGEICFEGYYESSRSPRYEFILRVPELGVSESHES